MVLRMSGRRRQIFFAGSTISGMRECEARNTQWFNSVLAWSLISHAHSDSKSRVNRLPGSAHGTRTRPRPRTRDSPRAASWRPVRPASSRNPDDANDARRHLGRNHDDVCHSGEHRSMPLRGRTRTSSTGSGRRGESTIRTVSTTTPLTLRSWLNMLFIRRFAVVCLSWSKTSYPESALLLLPQRLNDEPPPTKTAIAPYSTYR